MARIVAMILIACLAFVASGAIAFVHERLAHADERIAVADDAGHHDHDRPADNGHDGRAACVVCHALHAPLGVDTAPAAAVAANAVVGRVIDVQAQRLDAAVPPRIGCRGPPARTV